MKPCHEEALRIVKELAEEYGADRVTLTAQGGLKFCGIEGRSLWSSAEYTNYAAVMIMRAHAGLKPQSGGWPSSLEDALLMLASRAEHLESKLLWRENDICVLRGQLSRLSRKLKQLNCDMYEDEEVLE